MHKLWFLVFFFFFFFWLFSQYIAGIKAGDHVFVNGGSGGVGSSMVQISKAFGAYVVTTCSAANILTPYILYIISFIY
jgi:NADPH:quinone reductase-like Zn-dependent oxidoreductase